jgi:hypothetical protein
MGGRLQAARLPRLVVFAAVALIGLQALPLLLTRLHHSIISLGNSLRGRKCPRRAFGTGWPSLGWRADCDRLEFTQQLRKLLSTHGEACSAELRAAAADLYVSQTVAQFNLQRGNECDSAWRDLLLQLVEHAEFVRCPYDASLPQDPGKRILLAANLRNNGPLMPHWVLRAVQLAAVLPEGDMFVSVYESNSRASDLTRCWLEALRLMLEAMRVPHRIVSDGGLTRPRRSKQQGRIEFLAQVRCGSVTLQPHSCMHGLCSGQCCSAATVTLPRACRPLLLRP